MNYQKDLNNTKIILEMHAVDTEVSFVSEILLCVLHDTLSNLGIHFTVGSHDKFYVGFDDVEAFKVFHQQVLPQVRLASESSDSPLLIQVSYERVPNNSSYEELNDIASKPYHLMGVMVNQLSRSLFQLRFPSEEAYFTSMVAILQHCA